MPGRFFPFFIVLCWGVLFTIEVVRQWEESARTRFATELYQSPESLEARTDEIIIKGKKVGRLYTLPERNRAGVVVRHSVTLDSVDLTASARIEYDAFDTFLVATAEWKFGSKTGEMVATRQSRPNNQVVVQFNVIQSGKVHHYDQPFDPTHTFCIDPTQSVAFKGLKVGEKWDVMTFINAFAPGSSTSMVAEVVAVEKMEDGTPVVKVDVSTPDGVRRASSWVTMQGRVLRSVYQLMAYEIELKRIRE